MPRYPFKHLSATLLLLALTACQFGAGPGGGAKPVTPEASSSPMASMPPATVSKLKITAADNLTWQPLDPKSPNGLQVSPVYGDMWSTKNSFFLKVPAGGKSGLHAHSGDYYAVVVSGQPGHGNNAQEAETPLPVGSTWFQPGKAMHFDSCLGDKDCVLLLSYPNGPFDYIPESPAAGGQTTAPPVGAALKITTVNNLKWQPLDPKSPDGLKVSSVYGDMWSTPNSFFLKVPAGGKSGLHAHTGDYHAVVISGQPGHGNNEQEASSSLAVGSTWFQPGKDMHFDSCLGKEDCVLLLIYPNGPFDYIPEAAK